MSAFQKIPPQLYVPGELSLAIFEAAALMTSELQRQVFRLPVKSATKGTTLRPGTGTPLWNTLIAEIRPLLKKRGAQANLARLLGLPRQQINAFFSQRNRMPDAERTLQLLAWLSAVRQTTPPA